MLGFKFEHRREPLASPKVFRDRILQTASVAGVVIAISWGVGALGYHYLAHLPSWVDSFYNAAMILGGMGPVADIHSSGGKWFASFYALYSGVTLLTSVGILLSPLMHRLLHRFHLEAEASEPGEAGRDS
jgi:hypothetical protein